MKKTERLQLVSIKKSRVYYSGMVMMMFDSVKCMYGSHVKFRQKKIPKELLQYVGKDLSKIQKRIYVNCELKKIKIGISTVTESGEEYDVPTSTSDDSRVKILGI